MEDWNISQARCPGFHSNGKIILSRIFGEKECLGVWEADDVCVEGGSMWAKAGKRRGQHWAGWWKHQEESFAVRVQCFSKDLCYFIRGHSQSSLQHRPYHKNGGAQMVLTCLEFSFLVLDSSCLVRNGSPSVLLNNCPHSDLITMSSFPSLSSALTWHQTCCCWCVLFLNTSEPQP